MADTLTPEQRSRVMSRIRSKDTKPELRLRKGLYAAGVRGWRCHVKGVPGKPDVAFVGLKLAVFVDGGFWHGHPDHFTFGKSGQFWDDKIARNQERDRENDRDLAAAGWTVIRLWDFEVNRELERCVSEVAGEVARLRGLREQ